MIKSTYGKSYAYFVYAGLVIMNICAIYIAGGTGIYAATAFREYGRIDLEGIASVIAGFIYSVAMKNGVALGLTSVSIFGVCVFVLTVFKYKEPNPEP